MAEEKGVAWRTMVEVACRDCGKKAFKRYGKLADWGGRCRSCANKLHPGPQPGRKVEAACSRCGVTFLRSPVGGHAPLCADCSRANTAEIKRRFAERNKGSEKYYASVQCSACGKTWMKYRANLPQWKGFCNACGQASKKSGLSQSELARRSIERNKVMVTCSDCGASWRKNKESVKSWSGRCRSCSEKAKKNDPALKAKMREMWRGEKSTSWKGGVSTENEILRASSEYREWRSAVFTRDDFTCARCNQRGGVLHAHHILPFADYPELRLDVSNGQTLCEPCHDALHAATPRPGRKSAA